jgi:hypothetical protein
MLAIVSEVMGGIDYKVCCIGYLLGQLGFL